VCAAMSDKDSHTSLKRRGSADSVGSIGSADSILDSSRAPLNPAGMNGGQDGLRPCPDVRGW